MEPATLSNLKIFDEHSRPSLVHAMSRNKATYNGKEVEYKWQAYDAGGPDHWGTANCHSVGYVSEHDGSLGIVTCHGTYSV